MCILSQFTADIVKIQCRMDRSFLLPLELVLSLQIATIKVRTEFKNSSDMSESEYLNLMQLTNTQILI